MTRTYAFLDESGNQDLEIEKPGATNFFAVAAVVVEEQDLPELRSAVQKIREKHFRSGEIKSSQVKDKKGFKRRIEILSDIEALDFKVLFLLIDKSKINPNSGLKFKQSFVKFTNGIIYRKLFRGFDDLDVVVDQHGSKEFQESLKIYVEKNHIPDLLWNSSFSTVDSTQEVLIQLADFLVGSLVKVWDSRGSDELKKKIRDLEGKFIGFEEWPLEFSMNFKSHENKNDEDFQIYQHALRLASIFIRDNQNSCDSDVSMQVAVISYLVFQSKFFDERGYIPTFEILNHLKENGFPNCSEQVLRSSVIAKLRDNDVVIASSSQGYKIPKSKADLFDFVNRVSGQVLPLLERLKKARDSYRLATKGNLDLLGEENYRNLLAIVNRLSSKLDDE